MVLFPGHPQVESRRGQEPMAERPMRNRLVYSGLIAIAAWLGVHASAYGDLFPEFVADLAPQALWPLAVFAAVGLVFPSAASWQVASTAYVIAALFELSDLYHEPWIDGLRGTPLGALALGTDFLKTDLACYAFGVLLGYLIELWTLQ
jgi:hypothetical protein